MNPLIAIIILLWFSLSNASAANIIIDAGHGGKDNGASYTLNGKTYHEKNLTLDISRRLQRELRQQGHHITLTRNSDRYLSPKARLAYIRKKCKQLCLSIHIDAHHNPKIHGATVYIHRHSTAQTRTIATAIQRSLNPKRHIRQANFIILKNTKCPTLLIEMGYMSNPHDLTQLSQATKRRQMAHQIAQTLTQQLSQKPIPTT